MRLGSYAHPSVQHALELYLTTLPAGYFLVERFYPEERLPWAHLGGMALSVALWPIVMLAILRDGS